MNQIQLKNVLDILSQVTDLLYQENLKPAYMTLAAVLPQLEEVITGIKDEDAQGELTEKLRDALGAMETGDNTLLADMLQYDIMEQLKEFEE